MTYYHHNSRIYLVDREEPIREHYDSDYKESDDRAYAHDLKRYTDYILTCPSYECRVEGLKEGFAELGKHFVWGTLPIETIAPETEEDWKLAAYEARHELPPTPVRVAVAPPVVECDHTNESGFSAYGHFKKREGKLFATCKKCKVTVEVVEVAPTLTDGKVTDGGEGKERKTLGQLIVESMKNNLVGSVPDIPADIFEQLKADNFYPNSIPIIIFRNMLRLLNITIEEATPAIYKTFEICEEKKNKDREGKRFTEINWKEDLWKCEAAIDKYVDRLIELMPVTMFQQPPSPTESAEQLTIEDYKEVFEDHKRLVRELDVIINGENAAKQASLCDIVGQMAKEYVPAQQIAGDAKTELENILGTVNFSSHKQMREAIEGAMDYLNSLNPQP